MAIRNLYFLFCGSWKLKVIFNLGVVDGNLAFTSNQERSSCCSIFMPPILHIINEMEILGIQGFKGCSFLDDVDLGNVPN